MEKETIEGNKLIAEFMGGKLEPFNTNINYWKWSDTTHQKYNDGLSEHGLKFNSSWDWLMPVVEKITKIEDGKFSVNISSVGMWACYIKRDDVYEKNIVDYGGFEPMIMNVWKSVVEFIEWYNKKNKN